jgi:ribonuclease BN (tRNA processing enzyme)
MAINCRIQEPKALQVLDISILGAHNCEVEGKKCTSFLVNDKLAIDAGGLTSSLSTENLLQLKAILLTHHHFDHIKDIPILALRLIRLGATIDIYCSLTARDAINDHLLNGYLFPDFHNIPVEKPTIKFNIIETNKTYNIGGLDVLALPVNHPGNAFGYYVNNGQGKSFFYTGDTTTGLNHCWEHVSPDVLLTEITFPDDQLNLASRTRHLTPKLLEQELIRFKEIKGYWPRVIALHIDPLAENKIREELAEIARSIHVQINIAYEGMKITV